MLLSKSNIQRWIGNLTAEMKEQYEVTDYGSTRTDEEWLELYKGKTSEQAIKHAVELWKEKQDI